MDEQFAWSGRMSAGQLAIASMPSQAVSPLAVMVSRFHTAYPMVEVVVRMSAGQRASVQPIGIVLGGVTLLLA